MVACNRARKLEMYYAVRNLKPRRVSNEELILTIIKLVVKAEDSDLRSDLLEHLKVVGSTGVALAVLKEMNAKISK